jgi:signal transduction histidine kinase/CheY-like chemotaxis protein
MKKAIHFVTSIPYGIGRTTLIILFISFILFGGIILNFLIENKIHNSVKEHNTGSAFVIKHEQYKHIIDKITFTLSQIDNELNNLLLTDNKQQEEQLVFQMNELKQSVELVRQEAASYVPKYLVNVFIHKIRNRSDFQKNVLLTYQSKGKADALQLLNSHEDRTTLSDFANSETGLAAVLNQRIENLNNQRMSAEAGTLRLDKRWNLVSFIFMLAIAIVVVYQTIRISILNKKMNGAVAKMKHATRIKDQFMSNITHELRTPLNSILGYTNLLLKKKHEPDIEKWIQSVNSSGTLLLDVVNDVLDYSKLEAGYLHTTNEPFQLDDILSNLKNIISNRAEAKGLSLVILKDQSLPSSFNGDEKKLKQILINLAGNAVKFTEKGTVKIEVLLQKQIEDQYWLEFVISDTGIGIASENLKHVFERFYQVENSYTKKYSGTGLGLPIVKQLVDLQGGTISVNSNAGEGTSFRFVLPFEKVEYVKQEEINLAPVRKMLQTASKRILVVDDHELNRELLELILKEYNCRVVTAENGYEALQILQKMKFDMVLMDVQMPELNGIETTLKIRNQLVLELPIIACTAFSQPSEMKMCMEAGMNDYLGKPIEEKELLRLLNTYLNLNAEVKPESLINFKQIQSITGTNKELTANILSRAVSSIPEELEQLHEFIVQKNFKAAYDKAHSMCSTAGLMGASSKLMEKIKSIQYKANEDAADQEELLNLFYEVNDTVHKMISELKEYLAA